jgi:hypothetical protein
MVRHLGPWLLLLAACGQPLDPLTDLKAERAAWPEPEQADANAVVRVGAALGERLVAELVDGSSFASPPGPFGLRLIVLPSVDEASVRLTGDALLDLELDVQGTADLRTGFGGPSDLPWTAAIDATVALDARSTPEGLAVSLGLPTPDAMTVQVELSGLEGDAGAVASGAAAGALESSLAGLLAEPLEATLPATPGTPRDVRARAVDGGLVLDLALPALGPAATPQLPADPGDGFVAVVPEATLLAWGRAVASTQLPVGAAVFEPERVDIQDGTLVLEVKVHRTARRERWRRYRASVDLGLADGHLTADVRDLELLDKHRWTGGPTAVLAEAAAPARIATVASQVRTTHTASVGPKRALVIEVLTLELADDVLVLRGSVRAQRVTAEE